MIANLLLNLDEAPLLFRHAGPQQTSKPADHDLLNRRHFMGRALWGIGASALSHLLPQAF